MTKILNFPCPHCGSSITPPTKPSRHSIPTASRRTRALSTDELAALPVKARFAYYHKHAPEAELAFILANFTGDEHSTRALAESITNPTRADILRLRDLWRRERQAADRLSGRPAVNGGWSEENEHTAHVA